MSDILLDLWLNSPSISSPGAIVAFVVAVLVGWLCFTSFKAKAWNLFSKALAVTFWCFVSQLIVLLVGAAIFSTGAFGIARSWAAFGDAYVWGLFTTPFIALPVSLVSFALTPHLRGTR